MGVILAQTPPRVHRFFGLFWGGFKGLLGLTAGGRGFTDPKDPSGSVFIGCPRPLPNSRDTHNGETLPATAGNILSTPIGLWNESSQTKASAIIRRALFEPPKIFRSA